LEFENIGFSGAREKGVPKEKPSTHGALSTISAADDNYLIYLNIPVIQLMIVRHSSLVFIHCP